MWFTDPLCRASSGSAHPARPDTLRALGGAHARVGHYDQAAEWMHKAAEAIDEDEDLRSRLLQYARTIEAGESVVIPAK